uniref:Uncharacterized protein n=1 Tax=Glossina palpalis gambiensis TaxID=67801 RepID=A0A1B0AML4_9MUSC
MNTMSMQTRETRSDFFLKTYKNCFVSDRQKSHDYIYFMWFFFHLKIYFPELLYDVFTKIVAWRTKRTKELVNGYWNCRHTQLKIIPNELVGW